MSAFFMVAFLSRSISSSNSDRAYDRDHIIFLFLHRVVVSPTPGQIYNLSKLCKIINQNSKIFFFKVQFYVVKIQKTINAEYDKLIMLLEI